MSKLIFIFLLVLVTLELVVGPPVDQKKKDEEKKDKEKTEGMDDFGLEYGRYLQQVVQALEEDKEFAKKLENISTEQIRSGHIAKELEFVKHNVRSKLDELKRIEVDRLRKLIQTKMDRTELGLYRDAEGHLLNSPDGRRWRTLPGLDRKKGIKIPNHLDIENPHSFEIEDLKKLIQTATNDLEELDKQRREEFKKYELEKEATYRESLKNMTEDQRKEAEKHHQELIEKHKDHPKVHHPGSKPQLEQVWEDQDHLPKEEFNPRTFFAMHDINGDGHLDVEEIEAILIPEVRKLYNPNNEEDDPAEMMEEFHRMREHIFNETDKNKDALISLEEFLKMTEQQEFQKDEGWKGLDEQQVYSDRELEEYMRQRQMQYEQGYGDPRMYYDVGHNPQGVPPHINYQGAPGGMPQHPYPDPQFHQGQHPQGYPQFQQGGQFQQGHPEQFQQGHQAQFQQGNPQQQYQQGQVPHQQFQQGQVPHQQFQQGQVPHQQFQQGQVPQQQFQQGHPQQQFQQGQVPNQQFQQGQVPQQQFQQGQVPQQQFQQGQIPQQQFQQGHASQQQLNQGQQVVSQPVSGNIAEKHQQAAVPPQQAVPQGSHEKNEQKINEVHQVVASKSQEVPAASPVLQQVPPRNV